MADDEETLTMAVVRLASRYGRYGYRRVTAMLRGEGWRVNHKRVERIWRGEGLKVPAKQPKRGRLWVADGSCVRLRPQRRNHVWAYDFVALRTSDGRPVRLLTVVDEYTRECLAIQVGRSLRSSHVIECLGDIMVQRGVPDHVRSDNGPEFTALAVRLWLQGVGSTTLFITPGSPWENGYVESFNGKLRDELLDRELFDTLWEVQVLTEQWRHEYNHQRPHSALGYRPPAPEAILTSSAPSAISSLMISGTTIGGRSVGFVQSRSPHTEATLDMDATLVETRKQEALYSYKKHRAYQPLITYWSEAELIVHSEFRDGNVPAGHQQLRVLIEALGRLPAGVEKVMLRSDTAGYQRELLRYCAEGRDDRFGVIEFAVGVDVTAEFRRAVSEVAEQDWQTLYRRVGEHRVDTGQQWAEVNFVPNRMGHSKTSPEYRFIATRERLIEQPLPAMEGQMELPFTAMELSNRGWYKVFGVVTNRSIAADELIWWSRQRCGKGEEVHSVLKSDLAGGRLPSGLFGANAAWWAISVLAFNLNSAMKRLVLGGQWVGKRLKAVRLALIALPGRVMRHARRLIIRLARGHPSYELLLRARQRILALAAEPQRA